MPAMQRTATIVEARVFDMTTLMGRDTWSLEREKSIAIPSGSMVPTTSVGHGFWRHEGADRSMQVIQFAKNAAIVGGLLVVASTPRPTPASLVPRHVAPQMRRQALGQLTGQQRLLGVERPLEMPLNAGLEADQLDRFQLFAGGDQRARLSLHLLRQRTDRRDAAWPAGHRRLGNCRTL